LQLSTERPVVSAARGLLAFSRAVVRHAPLAIGAPPLPAPTTTDGVTWTFSVPGGVAAGARVACATDIPLVAVVGALRILSPSNVSAATTTTTTAATKTTTAATKTTTATATTTTSTATATTVPDEVAAFALQHDLTAAEVRVLRALDAGRKPADIAAALGSAVGTVRVHLKRIYRKTDTRSQRALLTRLAAVRAVFRP
jgi:DNA-binding NarL/FixJ family response regulator